MDGAVAAIDRDIVESDVIGEVDVSVPLGVCYIHPRYVLIAEDLLVIQVINLQV